MADAYLMHHGILGQKWGVRRYQNEDGSYTTAGRKRLHVNQYRLKRNDPVNKAAQMIQKQTAKGVAVGSTQQFVKQAAISAAMVTAGVVATSAVLKSESGKKLLGTKLSSLVKDGGGVNMKATMQYGKAATKVAIAVIGSGALISAGAARGGGATVGYVNYLGKGRAGTKENKKAAANIQKKARQSQRRIVYS